MILDQKIIDKLNELHSKYSGNKINNVSKNIKSDNINNKPVDDEEILNKYYYFNKSKNQYFKKTRYFQFDNCYKIGNFKDNNNKHYCKQHSNNNVVNINNKSKVIKCNYDNCKKNIKSDKKYYQNHKYKCSDNECDIRIMKNNFYCKLHK